MKTLGYISILLFSMTALALPTVDTVDLKRYQGKWHQLAAIPASFQEDCIGNTTAEYTLLQNGLIKVVNSCDRTNGDRRGGEARARINPDFNESSKLEVTFVNLFGWRWAFSGDYWITYLEQDYSVAIVGSPDYEFGWILARDQSLSVNEYLRLRDKITDRGYDACQFIMSDTEEQSFDGALSLCDL